MAPTELYALNSRAKSGFQSDFCNFGVERWTLGVERLFLRSRSFIPSSLKPSRTSYPWLPGQACLLAKTFGVVRFYEGWSSEKLWVTLSPDKLPTGIIISPVSASDIIKELPKLSEAERRAIREGLLEIANQDPDVALCNQAALDGALMLDRMEDEDARRQSG